MKNVEDHISNWMKDYCLSAGMEGFVVGVSGGVDSALTSTLAARTGLKTVALVMPINQAPDQTDRGLRHCDWLHENFPNAEYHIVPLTKTYNEFLWWLPVQITNHNLTLANTKSRLRMVTLYAVAGAYRLLVAGTGNKVEDYGIGFFTKYGDGGVDISPIGELTKTEVWDLARKLGINQEIIDATPTDGLHPDNRSDESQIGASYEELEWAMDWCDENNPTSLGFSNLTDRQKQVLDIYKKFHSQNAHKMQMPPICPKMS